MSSEVQAKCTNSSERATSRFFASFSFSQYSIALTSWLVRASIALMRSPSFSENPDTSRSSAVAVGPEKALSSAIAGSAASALSQASSIRTR